MPPPTTTTLSFTRLTDGTAFPFCNGLLWHNFRLKVAVAVHNQGRRILRKTILWLIAAVLAVPAFAASTDQEFYDGVYRRGVAAFDAGDYATALGKLRIAAFGFVEDLPRFETAQVYIAA